MLDPTCGSGAFLFAAMNILEPLYETCLDRMAELAGPKYPDFGAELARVAKHPNRAYFIYKSIIIHNLYGVDIMEEAVEICKLRLFLKLVAQVDDVARIEPLPDIDFNIRAGNTLVGYATKDEVAAAGSRSLFNLDLEERILEATRGLDAFREMQDWLGVSPATLAQAKTDVRGQLRDLEVVLDEALANEYSMDVAPFVASHHPFHWYVQFHGIMREGGFDVIVGNPPYVEIKDVRDYRIRGYATDACSDLYAYVMERSLHLARVGARIGLIVPISSFGTDGFTTLQTLMLDRLSLIWISCFANRPGQLFDGAQKRLTILLGKNERPCGSNQPLIHTTSYLRWIREERDVLFPARLSYVMREYRYVVFPGSLEKLGSTLETQAFRKLISRKERLEQTVTLGGQHVVYYTRKFGYFLAFLDFIPLIINNRTNLSQPPSELKEFRFSDLLDAQATVAALSSTTFFWFWNVLSDCRNLNKRDLLAFPFSPALLTRMLRQELGGLGERYLRELRGVSRMMRKGDLSIQTFEYAACKPIIDEIDRVLAQHYGFTAAELDFIINYDIKYRMGKEAADESE